MNLKRCLKLTTLFSPRNFRPMSTKSVEVEIEELHRLACAAGKTSYKDPATGYTVFTEEFHKKRGKCCGNGCRHCPFDYVNVPEERRASLKSNKK